MSRNSLKENFEKKLLYFKLIYSEKNIDILKKNLKKTRYMTYINIFTIKICLKIRFTNWLL